jgi:hypothetical protein
MLGILAFSHGDPSLYEDRRLRRLRRLATATGEVG